MTKLLHADIIDKALRAYYTVYNAHGHDYPEAFFEKMMQLEFEAMGVRCVTQVTYTVTYRGVIVGKHITDTELAACVVLEYKVAPQLQPRHYAQLLSNLKISGKQVGLLLNFGSLKPEYKRLVLTNNGQERSPSWQPGPPDPTILYPDLRLALFQALLTIHCELGPGFTYRVYINATAVELRHLRLFYRRFRKLEVEHRGQAIGVVTFHHFIAEDKVLVAPIAVTTISQSDINKVRTLLKKHGLLVGMIANFHEETLQVRYVRLG